MLKLCVFLVLYKQLLLVNKSSSNMRLKFLKLNCFEKKNIKVVGLKQILLEFKTYITQYDVSKDKNCFNSYCGKQNCFLVTHQGNPKRDFHYGRRQVITITLTRNRKLNLFCRLSIVQK